MQQKNFIYEKFSPKNLDENMTTIITHYLHVHDHLLTKYKSRDFHKIAIELYNNIPEEEQKTHLYNFNKFIMKWHYQPGEAWGCPNHGIWKIMECYLGTNFSDLEKYKQLVKIFNNK